MSKMQVIAFSVYIAGQPRYRDAFSRWPGKKGHEFEALLAMLHYSQSGNKRDAIRIIDTYLLTGSPAAISFETANEVRNGVDFAHRTSHYRAYFQERRRKYLELREEASRMNFFSRTWTAGSRKADLALFDEAIDVLDVRIDVLQARPWAAENATGAEALRKYESYGCLHSRKTALEKIKVQELHLSNAAHATSRNSWY